MKILKLDIRGGMNAAALAFAALMLPGLNVAAGEAAADTEKVVYKPMTWRPFKDVPEVLFYESFESQSTWVKIGKFTEDAQAPSGKGVLSLVPGKDGTASSMSFTFPPQLKIPSGLNPKDINVQVAMYSEEAGTVTVTFKHAKGNYADTAPVPKTKGWGHVTMKLSDMMAAKKRAAEPDQVITEMDISVKGLKSAKTPPKVMIDDLVFTLVVNPNDVRGRIIASEKKRTEMEKSIERDGYQYSMKINDYLKEYLKPFKGKKKAKNVLVVGGDPEHTESLLKSLTAAPKSKEAGFTYGAFDGPDTTDKTIGGLTDMRTMIQYNLAKNPEMVVLALGINDALAGGRPAESVRVIVERALSVGTVPVVLIPAAQNTEQLTKLVEFAKNMQERCAQMGVPCIDASHLQKNAKGELDIKTTPVVAPEKLAVLLVTAIKQCHDSVTKD